MLLAKKGPNALVITAGIVFHAPMATLYFGLSTFSRGISFFFPSTYCQ